MRGLSVGSLFCGVVLGVRNLAEEEREIYITLLLLCCGCLCSMAFPDHTHLLLPFLSNCADANYVYLAFLQ